MIVLHPIIAFSYAVIILHILNYGEVMNVKTPNDLSAFWMPFTANRQFKSNPRLFAKADGMYYKTVDGRQVMDGVSGLWCCNAGHNHPKIVEAIREQAGELDYAPAFQMGHPKAFELASQLTAMAPEGMDYAFFTNSGSESVETALKIALSYHRANGEGQRTRLIGREKGYHGVNFGGTSVGGMVNNRRYFGNLLSGVDHLPHTYDRARNAFTKGLPEHGIERAEALEELIALHGGETIAAVIVEPMSGSGGVILPPAGYLQRLREITQKHGILLIFDEVITGFGRLGEAFGSDYFGVVPDLMTTAKGLTNGVIPMGAVLCQSFIYDTFMNAPDNAIELFHGYTYSGTPIAAAAGLACLEVYREEGLFDRAKAMAPKWEEALHSLRDLPGILDIRNLGLVGAIDLEPFEDAEPYKRTYEIFLKAFEAGLYVRMSGDSIALSPPLIMNDGHLDELITKFRGAIEAV